MLKFIPVGSAPLGEVIYSIPSPSTENQFLGRADWNQSARDTVFGRYYYAKDNNPAAFGGDLLLTTQAGVIDTVQALTAGDTFSLTANAVNAFHFTWSYERINRGPAGGIPSAADSWHIGGALAGKLAPDIGEQLFQYHVRHMLHRHRLLRGQAGG